MSCLSRLLLFCGRLISALAKTLKMPIFDHFGAFFSFSSLKSALFKIPVRTFISPLKTVGYQWFQVVWTGVWFAL
ncbi:hypothetical protein [Endozoicomonas sp. 4G]|uniref:hypothetical protein n=1 Tax=Endozoicomonas sp. 4G TaxID=2872754 RepID=UPI0020786298|nr:hypothetical protein [Endozoicomonas sp. 4G]